MAELLVRVMDKTSANPLLDCKLTKRGHVICVQPDGWTWGLEEVANPAWRIVRVPGVDPSDLTGLLAPEPEVDPKNPSLYLQRRAFKLDLDHPEISKAALRTFFDDGQVAPITAKDGETLEQVKQAEIVPSTSETLTPVKDANGDVIDVRVEKTTTQRTVEKYAVADLSPAVAAKLAGLAVEKVAATLRANVVADVDPSVIVAVTVAVARIADPKDMGESGTVIG